MQHDGTEKNHDMCDACGDGGDLLCCDNCPNAFHFECVFPPIDPKKLPEGDWYCNSCAHKLGKRKKNKINSDRLGPLKKFYDFLSPQNPKVFSLPTSVKRAVSAPVYKRNEIKGLDMLPILKMPDSAVARYTPEDRESRKGRTVRGAAPLISQTEKNSKL
jgi:hypothetical protein